MWNWLSCQDEFFMDNPPVKENGEHWLCSLPVLPFSVSVSLDFSIQTAVSFSCFLPQIHV
jgi:hypothetical protein